jgi:hypothetical protein
MIKIIVFKPNGEAFRTIKNPIAHNIEGPLLTATYTPPNGKETSIRTTLPFYFEDNEGDSEGTTFKETCGSLTLSAALTQLPDFVWGGTTLLFYNPDPLNVRRWESLKTTHCDPVPEDASLEVDVVVAGARWAVVAVWVWLSDHTHAPTGAASL